MHPYPDPPETGPPTWEISAHRLDILEELVEFDRWHTQVVVVEEIAGVEHHTFYWDYENNPGLSVTYNGNRLGNMPPAADPAIIVGDAPWQPGYENYHGVLRGFQYYDTNLSLAEIDQEIASPGSAGRLWYLNLNPTPSDISDKSGNGNDPIWIGSARPALWRD